MHQLLAGAFQLPVASGVAAHKHWMQPAPNASLAGAVVVVMARNPYDWMIQMWRKCYHCGAMQKVPAFRCGAAGGRRGRAGEGACVGRRLGFF